MTFLGTEERFFISVAASMYWVCAVKTVNLGLLYAASETPGEAMEGEAGRARGNPPWV